MNNLVSYLFNTNAVRVCAENKPFWYTSGKIGPYFINTHFLYGSENDANSLLDFINLHLQEHMELPNLIYPHVYSQYKSNSIYQDVINEMLTYIKENINIDEIDYISGGERRDWFFSIMISNLLKKPHLTLYKDGDVVCSNFDFSQTTKISSIKNKQVLHVADLLTQASSYVKLWHPTIEKLGGLMKWSIVVIDRMQGSIENMKKLNIASYSMIQITDDLFNTALELGVITQPQFDMILKFIKNPDDTMRTFLIEHPEFLENALNSDAKIAARAKSCIEQNLYNLN